MSDCFDHFGAAMDDALDGRTADEAWRIYVESWIPRIPRGNIHNHNDAFVSGFKRDASGKIVKSESGDKSHEDSFNNNHQ